MNKWAVALFCAVAALFSNPSSAATIYVWTNMPGWVDVPGVAGTMAFTNPTPSLDDFYNVRVRMAE